MYQVAFVQALDLTLGQISRITRGLHKFDHKGDVGLDLVDVTFDLHHPKTKLVRLNANGVAKAEKLLEPSSL